MKKLFSINFFLCVLIALIYTTVFNDNVKSQDVPPLDDSVTTKEVPGVDSFLFPEMDSI